MFLPNPFTHDEILQFILTYIGGDSSFCHAVQSMLCTRAGRHHHHGRLMMPSLQHRRCCCTTRGNNGGTLSRSGRVTVVYAVLVSLLLLILIRSPVPPIHKVLHIMKSSAQYDVSSFSSSATSTSSTLQGEVLDYDHHHHNNLHHHTSPLLNRRLNTSPTENTISETATTPHTKDDATTTSIYTKIINGNGQTVIAMGVSNHLMTYKLFIESLRHTGFEGIIVLGRPSSSSYHKTTATATNTKTTNTHHFQQLKQHYDEINTYLQSQNNIIINYLDVLEGEHCDSHVLLKEEHNQYRQPITCIKPYTNIKLGWTGHLLARDWLKQCPSTVCYGPVLLLPLTNIYFQSNPFEFHVLPGSGGDDGAHGDTSFLHLYEDHPNKTINNNLALEQCKKFMWDVPYIKSIIYADRTSISFYLENMASEIYTSWRDKSECYLSNTGIAIHNFLFYNGLIPANGVFEDRMNLVNSVGEIAKEILMEGGDGEALNNNADDVYDNKDWINDISKTLLAKKYLDKNGYFLNMDGLPSPIVHQINGFGKPLRKWLYEQPFLVGDNDDDDGGKTTYHYLRGKHGKENDQLLLLDNPMDNSLFYLSLEASYVDIRLEKKFLRKRKAIGRVVHEGQREVERKYIY